MSDTAVLVGVSALIGYSVYCAMKKSTIESLHMPMAQIIGLPVNKMAPGTIIQGVEKVHQNRTDLIASNGVHYIVYSNGGDLPASIRDKLH